MAVIALSRERRSADAERPQGLTEAELHRLVEEQTGALFGLARRFSPSAEDARDAVQSALEILLRHRHRIGAEWMVPWLHTVVKHEALRLRREGSRGLALEDHLERHGAPQVPSADELCARIDLRARARRDLPRLKAQERRALGLLAAGHFYREVCSITGWSYTKVNRCITEGRAALRVAERAHEAQPPTRAA